MDSYRAPKPFKDIQTAEEILERSPFLDIRNLTPLDLDFLISNAKIDKASADVVTDFSTFIELNPYPKLSQKLIKEHKRKYYGSLQYLDFSDRFLAQLTFEHVTPALLENHFNFFEKYCDEEIQAGKLYAQSLSTIACPMLLEAFVRWQSVENLSDVILHKFEALLQRVNIAIKDPNSDFSELIEAKNILVVSYILITECLSKGISPSVLAYHLVIYRHNSIKRWNSLHPKLRFQYAGLCLRLFLRFYKLEDPFETKLGFSFNTLSDLHAVLYEQIQSTSDRAFLSYRQLFQRFMERIESEALPASNPNSEIRAFQGLSPSEHMLMVELMRRFSSYRYPITMHHFEKFLLQFKTTRLIRAMLRLLNGVKFYPLWQLAEVIEGLLREEVKKYGSVIVAPLGDLTGSTAIINYLASHANLTSVRFADDLNQALLWTKNGDRVYFVDDCVLSGTQTINVLKDLLGLRKLEPHHTKHADPLDPADRAQLLNRNIVFTYCVA